MTTQPSGTSTNVQFGTTKGGLTDYARDLENFVVIGMHKGQPKIWTSEADIRQVRNLISQVAPQFSGELTE